MLSTRTAAGRAAPGDGQLRRSPTLERPRLACAAPAIAGALHPDPRLLDEPGLVRHRRAPIHPPRHLHVRQRPQQQDPRLHRRLERTIPPFIGTKAADQILAKANRPTTSNRATRTASGRKPVLTGKAGSRQWHDVCACRSGSRSWSSRPPDSPDTYAGVSHAQHWVAAWGWTTAAVAMSVIAAVLLPVAVLIANWGKDPEEHRPARVACKIPNPPRLGVNGAASQLVSEQAFRLSWRPSPLGRQ